MPVDHRITGPHQRHPEREELSHHDESEWPIEFGEPADVWRDSRYIHLLDPKTAEEHLRRLAESHSIHKR